MCVSVCVEGNGENRERGRKKREKKKSKRAPKEIHSGARQFSRVSFQIMRGVVSFLFFFLIGVGRPPESQIRADNNFSLRFPFVTGIRRPPARRVLGKILSESSWIMDHSCHRLYGDSDNSEIWHVFADFNTFSFVFRVDFPNYWMIIIKLFKLYLALKYVYGKENNSFYLQLAE